MAINNFATTGEHSFSRCIPPKKVSLLANTAKVVLEPNIERMYAVVINRSNSIVDLSLGDTATNNGGIPLMPFGTYEINRSNLYKGRITAISTANIDLIAFECFKQ